MTTATPSLTTASTEEIRSHFPALNRVHNGEPVAYFDGPGGTQVPSAVVDAMADYLVNHNANTHWNYPSSAETDQIILDARQAFADLVNASPEEIAFGQNMTTLTFHLARAIGRGLSAGDEIILTELDHHANVDTWRALEKDRGVTVRLIPLNLETGTLDMDALPGLISAKTRVIAIGAASNALGTVNDIRRACKLARDAGAISFVDAVHYAAHGSIDVQEIGCDFLACSPYKFYGPHMGVLYGRREAFEAVDFPRLRPAPSHIPDCAETGTLSHEAIAGGMAAVNYIASLSEGESRRARIGATLKEIHGRHEQLVRRMWEGLSAIPGVRMYGPGPGEARTSTVSFTVKGLPSEEVAGRLAHRGVFASSGDFYALTVVEKYGLAEEGLVRAGCAFYTTPEEVDRLVEGVEKVGASQ